MRKRLYESLGVGGPLLDCLRYHVLKRDRIGSQLLVQHGPSGPWGLQHSLEAPIKTLDLTAKEMQPEALLLLAKLPVQQFGS